MPQRSRRKDGPQRGRVPAPRLSRQLAQAAVDQTSAATEVAQPEPESSVPTDSRLDQNVPGSGCHESPHMTELQVRHHLMEQSELMFSSLVVRRMNNGLCLQGVVETHDKRPDFASLVREVAAVDNVISQLVVRPRKG